MDTTQLSFFGELAQNVSGGLSAGTWASLYFFFILGVLVSLGVNIMGRDKQSKNTPVTFKWGFFFKDNYYRLLLAFIVSFWVFRFFGDIFLNLQISMWWASAIGLVFDRVIVWIREKKYQIDLNLGKSMTKYNGDQPIEQQ